MTRFVRVFAIGAVGIAASGCTLPMTNGPEHMYNVEEQFPIVVEPQVATLVVQVDDGMQSLGRGEDERVKVFVTRWKMRGQGMLNAAAPTGTANQAAATVALEQLKKVLAQNGVPKNSVQFTSYRPASDDTRAPISLSFVTYAATAPECGQDWSENLGFTPRNQPWPEFGCSTQHNMAAIVSDPRDLIEPKASDSTDADRRSTVLGKYRNGEVTAAQSSGTDSVSISTVGQ